MGEFISHYDKLPITILNKLKEFKEERQLCDFSIETRGEEFRVHKILLATCSEYFRAMFTGDNTESRSGRVLIEDVDPKVMSKLIDFCYTCQIPIHEDNVQNILIAASRFQFPEILELCIDFLDQRYNVENCVEIMMLAHQHNLKRLYDSIFGFCLDHFKEIADGEEYGSIDSQQLVALISNDRLNVDEEQEVVDAVLKWHNVGGRNIEELDKVACNIRWTLLDPASLVEISSHDTIKQLSQCREIINKAKDFILLQLNPEKRSQLFDCNVIQPRITLRKQQRIYVIGGWTTDSKSMATAEKYDPYLKIWTEIEPMTRPRCGVGVVMLGEYIYAIGGHDGERYLKSVERYNTSTGKWLQDVCDMQIERTSVGVVALNGYIYAIGGQSRSCSPLDDVERYDPRTNTWTFCAPLQQKRLGAGATVFNGYIYVVGGASSTTLGSVERYNPSQDTWTPVASMNMNRKHLGCTAIPGVGVVAVGGRSDSNELDSVEMYDPQLNTWNFMPKMSVKRSGIGLVELDGFIYAVGGLCGEKQLKLVEAFDLSTKRWTTREPLIHQRLGGGLVVHSRVNNKSSTV